MLLLNDSLYHQKRKGSKYFYLLPFLMFKKERRGKTFASGLPKKEMKKEILCNDYEVKNGKALVFEINGKDHNVTVKDLETDGAEFRIEAPRAIYCSAKFFHFGKHLDQITPDRTFPNYWENTEKLKYPANEIGYCRADHDGYRWWSKWFKVNGNADDPSEIDTIFDEIQDNIKNLHILHEFAKVHCADISNDESNGFLEGEQYDYWFRFIFRKGDYNMYMHVLKKGECKVMMSAKEIAQAWDEIVEIYKNSTDRTPVITMQMILNRFSIEDVKTVFATVYRLKYTHDGRIYGSNKDFLSSIPVDSENTKWESSNPVMRAKLDDIHPSHINQLVTALREYA